MPEARLRGTEHRQLGFEADDGIGAVDDVDDCDELMPEI